MKWINFSKMKNIGLKLIYANLLFVRSNKIIVAISILQISVEIFSANIWRIDDNFVQNIRNRNIMGIAQKVEETLREVPAWAEKD